MKSSLVDILRSYGWNSILIEGPWGCGKTFAIHKFLEDNKLNYKYISLFGIKDDSEFKKILFSFIDSSSIAVADDFVVIDDVFADTTFSNSINEESAIIIFDDIERINQNGITYHFLLGIINKLKKLGFKIICITSDHIAESEIFNKFKEKTFDICYSYSSPTVEAVNDIVGEDSLLDHSKIFEYCGNNLRILEKAISFFNYSQNDPKSICHLQLRKYGLTKKLYFSMLILAFRCIFSTNGENREKTIKNDFQKFRYTTYIDEFGIYIANELFDVYKSKLLISDLQNDMLEKIIKFVQTYDNSIFEEYLIEKETKGLLSKEYFYLSDTQKISYAKELIKNIKRIKFNEQNLRKVLTILLNSKYYQVSEEEIELIAKSIIDSKPNEITSEYIMSEVNLLIDSSDNYNIENIKLLIKKMGKFEINSYQDSISSISSLKRINYSRLLKLVDDFNKLYPNQKDELIKFLKNNDYFLPNLAGELSEISWHYVHKMCNIISSSYCKENLYNRLKTDLYSTKSESEKERIFSLLKKYFGETY